MRWEAIAFGLVLFMQVWAGINDGGNLLASAVGARGVSPGQAVAILVGATCAGPFLLGTHVAQTIATGIVRLPVAQQDVGIIGAMTGTVASVLVAYTRRVPTSLSLGVVGGLAGSALALGSQVLWAGVGRVAAGLLSAVVLGFGLGWGSHALLLAAGSRMRRSQGQRLLALQPVILALQGLAYGANDAEKALGLLVWILTGRPRASAEVPAALVLLSSAAWLLGLLFGGQRIAASVGLRVFRMRALHALSVQTSAAATVAVAAFAGLPVSTTQTVDASLMGVGLCESPRRLHWQVAYDMAVALGVTGPLALVLGFTATRLLL